MGRRIVVAASALCLLLLAFVLSRSCENHRRPQSKNQTLPVLDVIASPTSPKVIPLSQAREQVVETWLNHERKRALRLIFAKSLHETSFWNPDSLAAWRACPTARAAAMEYITQAKLNGEARERTRTSIFEILLGDENLVFLAFKESMTNPLDTPGIRNALATRIAQTPNRRYTPLLISRLETASNDAERTDSLLSLLQYPDPTMAKRLLAWLRSEEVRCSPVGPSLLREVLDSDLWKEAVLRQLALDAVSGAVWFEKAHKEIPSASVGELGQWLDLATDASRSSSPQGSAWLAYGKLFAFSRGDVLLGLEQAAGRNQEAKPVLDLYRADLAVIDSLNTGKGSDFEVAVERALVIYHGLVRHHQEGFRRARSPQEWMSITADPNSGLRMAALIVILERPPVVGRESEPPKGLQAALLDYLAQVQACAVELKDGRHLEWEGEYTEVRLGTLKERACRFEGSDSLRRAREELVRLSME